MQRVLDLDLDAFLWRCATSKEPDGPRLDPGEYPPWDSEQVMAFLTNNCGLSGRLPGAAVTNHAEVFYRWRDSIASGLLTPPFEVVHVDAHADIGAGDTGYTYLLSELLREPPEERQNPRFAWNGMSDGNYLLFAIAAGWISKVTYVVGGRDPNAESMDYQWQPGDLLPYAFENSDLWTRTIRLPTYDRKHLRENLSCKERLVPESLEPPVPFDWMQTSEYHCDKPFDFVFLAQSPAFTPADSDATYKEIRTRFIKEHPVERGPR